jgi:hypothetical protein
MTRPRLLLVAVPALLAAGPTHARAQSSGRPAAPDTLPFHAGQWGVEGGVFGSGGNVGALRFLTRATAIAINASAAYGSFTTDRPGIVGAGASTSTSSTTVGATLGVRHYAAAGGPIAGFLGGGLVTDYTRRSADPGGGSGHTTGVGGFAELGASYFVSTHLALGAAYGVTALHRSGTDVSTVFSSGAVSTFESQTRGWTVATGGVRITASLFF